MKHIGLFALAFGAGAAFALTSCGRPEASDTHNSNPTFTVGFHTSGIMVGFVGHEVLTRMAIEALGRDVRQLGSAEIRDGLIALNGEVLPDDLRSSGFGSRNPLVLGNVHTDAPEEWSARTQLPNLVEIFEREFGIPRGESWHDGDRRQQTHFLRNFAGTSIESARDACTGALAKVTRLSELSVGLMKAGDTRGALYLAGSSLHTLQDSFSAAHAPRDARNKRLENVCTYGREATTDAICYHTKIVALPGLDDSIWRSFADRTVPRPGGGVSLALKETAVAAALSSEGYLRVMSHLYASSDPVAPALQAFYLGKSQHAGAERQGAWDCSTLSTAKGQAKP